ncbi:tannase/feruloyl esterase family alpha/beta hydrolase [Burkholderia cepacia]|uniref:tannase/feruloyl esterase family alpha/beta hydrolase n=1 Tax=Burkholderia cepacia TaxID=292 RepID=UPI0009BE658E|nr:tannase/feruloyl esterase family alpha/beta hydrolase [Burkholderia cepacia]
MKKSCIDFIDAYAVLDMAVGQYSWSKSPHPFWSDRVLFTRRTMMNSRTVAIIWTGSFMALLGGCDGTGGDIVESLPQLAAATPGTLEACTSLADGFKFANTTINSAEIIPAGTVAGSAVGQHCLVKGEMYRRSGVNGSYAIGFEMRMPTAWNGRFVYQGNGGSDGVVVAATAPQGNSASMPSGLSMGFAVLSSDAGHNSAQNTGGPNHFALDPQARLDYGYQAVGKLTPMARELVKAAYGRQPDRMYMAGCSNGGRHGMVAASRYADQYDGIVAGDPGFDLPKAAVEVAWDTQQLSRIATPGSVNPLTGGLDLGSGFTAQERALVAAKIVAKCDALDGATDGMVLNVDACQTAFDLQKDVPTCTAARDGTCLTVDQKSAVANIFAGARNSMGTQLYSSFPLDPGVGGSGWANWKTYINVALGGASTPYIFTTPPVQVAPADFQSFLTGVAPVIPDTASH